jgi:signal transduction histidine kinase
LNPQAGIQPNLHNEFVELDCEFLGSVRAASKRTILQCRSGDTFFESNWTKSDTETSAPETSAPEPGDTIRLRGIYEVTTISPIPRIEWANGFRMHLLENEAVEILKKAPWWTFNRLLWALGIALAAISLILVWTNLLRRRVAIQTKIISRQVERSAIKDERQRIARELHDTLEQDLTGLSMQLENALDEIGTVNKPANRSLTLVHKMLQHCRLEAHSSVSDLRNSKLLMRPLAEAMKESLEEKARETGVSLDFSLEGEPRILRSTTQNHLLRIARESLNNAHRHGKASRVHCLLAYAKEGITLEVEDNGSGFDTSLAPPVGHFGLTGMRERANKIHAQFSLTSTPGQGTKVHVYMPYTSPEAVTRERKFP